MNDKLLEEMQGQILMDARHHTKYAQPKFKTITERRYASFIAGATASPWKVRFVELEQHFKVMNIAYDDAFQNTVNGE